MNPEETPNHSDIVTPKEQKMTNSVSRKESTIQGQDEGVFRVIKHITAWVIVISAVLFALIGVLAVWDAFGTKANDVVWRAFSSLVIIAFAAFIVNIASRIAVGKH